MRCGLDRFAERFAERFADAGFHALAFDYRFFGASEGEPRQFASPKEQQRDWANRVCARVALTGTSFRPIRHVGRVACPVLFQIAGQDAVVANRATERAAAEVGDRATLLRYDGDHFELYDGPSLERAVSDQVAFFEKTLRAPSGPSLGR